MLADIVLTETQDVRAKVIPNFFCNQKKIEKKFLVSNETLTKRHLGGF